MNKGRNYITLYNFHSIKPLDYFVTGHNTLISKQYVRIMYNSVSRWE